MINRPKLKDSTRNLIKSFLFRTTLDNMFNDGLEEDYVRNGVSFVGVDNMSDEKLLDELALSLGVDDEEDDLLLNDPEYELYQKARREMESNKSKEKPTQLPNGSYPIPLEVRQLLAEIQQLLIEISSHLREEKGRSDIESSWYYHINVILNHIDATLNQNDK